MKKICAVGMERLFLSLKLGEIMKKIKLIITGFVLLTLSFFIAGCNSGGGDDDPYIGTLYAGKKGDAKALSRALGAGEEEKFSIGINYMVGSTTGYGPEWWLIKQDEGVPDGDDPVKIDEVPDEKRRFVIPLTSSQSPLGDLNRLKTTEGHTMCDYIQFGFLLFYDGEEIANFPETMFIMNGNEDLDRDDYTDVDQQNASIFSTVDAEKIVFYENAQTAKANRPYATNSDPPTYPLMTADWTDYRKIFRKYPDSLFLNREDKVGYAGLQLWDDFVVINFEGIDLTREFDLKFEWDLDKLKDALAKAQGEGGYDEIQDQTEDCFQDFYKSLALKVIYR
jgi:hypothetical protein